jgi:hypothetical protein
MSTDTFDSIVQPHSGARPQHEDKLVVRAKAAFPRWAGPPYLVSRRGEASGEVKVDAGDYSDEYQLTLRIQYRVKAVQAGSFPLVAEQIVATLCQDAHRNPRAEFEERLRDAAKRAAREQGNLAAWLDEPFEARARRLAETVSRVMRNECQLEVGMRLELLPPDGYQARSRVRSSFETILTDYTKAVRGIVTVDLQAQPTIRPYVFHAKSRQLSEAIEQEASRWLAGHSLHQAAYGLDATKAALRAKIVALAKMHGRDVVGFAVECIHMADANVEHDPSIPAQTFVFDRPVTYPEPVTVTCEFHAKLVDLGRYVAAHSPAISQWFKAEAGAIIERHLLDVSYVGLFQRADGQDGFDVFERKREDTKQRIREAAEAIGYKAYLVEIRTTLSFDELRRQFTIPIEDQDFDLAAPKCQAKLDVNVVTKLGSREDIVRIFRRDPNIKGVIRKEIIEALATVLKATSPTAYYDMGPVRDGQTPVKEQLAATVHKLLERYHAESVEVRIQFHESELQEHFSALRKSLCALRIESERAGQVIVCTMQVRELYPHSFQEFVRDRPTIGDMITRVTEAAVQWMNDCRRDDLAAATDIEIERSLNQYLQKVVARATGLVVELTGLRREASPEEKAFLQKTRAATEHTISEVDESVEAPLKEARATRDDLERALHVARLAGNRDRIASIEEMLVQVRKEIARLEGRRIGSGHARVIQDLDRRDTNARRRSVQGSRFASDDQNGQHHLGNTERSQKPEPRRLGASATPPEEGDADGPMESATG